MPRCICAQPPGENPKNYCVIFCPLALTDTLEDYEALALRLAKDPSRQQGLGPSQHEEKIANPFQAWAKADFLPPRPNRHTKNLVLTCMGDAFAGRVAEKFRCYSRRIVRFKLPFPARYGVDWPAVFQSLDCARGSDLPCRLGR
jgi:hypothetical protein